MPEKYLRLSEFTAEIQRTITHRFAGQKFWVMADVTSHLYKADKRNHFFELVEKDPGSGSLLAKIQAKAWGTGSDSIDRFEKVTGQQFTSNIRVLMCLEVQYHPQFGLQANLLEVDVNFTLGALEIQRRQTLEKLVANNPEVVWKVGDKYYTRNNQLQLPLVVQRIAVIASRTSAGAEDLRHTLASNSHGYRFVVDEYHAPVQGDQFAREIVKQLIAIHQSQKAYDVVVITRGGGAQTDFLIFENYDLARAIARFPLPVITGIGHLRNESIADWMAHSAVKTPTKAAEFILAHNRAFEEKVMNHQHTIIIRSQQRFAKNAEQLAHAYGKMITQTNRLLSAKKDEMNRVNRVVTGNSAAIVLHRRQALVSVTTSLLSRPKTIIGNQQNNLRNVIANLKTFNAQYLKNQKGYVTHFDKVVRLMSPMDTLRRGFAIVKHKNRIYTPQTAVSPGEEIEIILSEKKLLATLNQETDKHATDTDL